MNDKVESVILIMLHLILIFLILFLKYYIFKRNLRYRKSHTNNFLYVIKK